MDKNPIPGIEIDTLSLPGVCASNVGWCLGPGRPVYDLYGRAGGGTQLWEVVTAAGPPTTQSHHRHRHTHTFLAARNSDWGEPVA